MPAPLSQRVVMPDSLSKYTSRTADMTGLIARRSRQSRDDGSDVVTSLGTRPWLARCSVFKDRSAPRPKGLFAQARTASRATTQYIGEIVLHPVDGALPLPRGTRQCSGAVNAPLPDGYVEPSTTRTKRRFPTWSTLPSSSAMGTSSRPP